jgi:hypothetical protein
MTKNESVANPVIGGPCGIRTRDLPLGDLLHLIFFDSKTILDITNTELVVVV